MSEKRGGAEKTVEAFGQLPRSGKVITTLLMLSAVALIVVALINQHEKDQRRDEETTRELTATTLDEQGRDLDTVSEGFAVQLACHHAVEGQLRNSDSADFESWEESTNYRRDDGTWEFYGWVDAENGFGGTGGATYSCEAAPRGDGLFTATATLDQDS